jgi:hypothetical protein
VTNGSTSPPRCASPERSQNEKLAIAFCNMDGLLN